MSPSPVIEDVGLANVLATSNMAATYAGKLVTSVHDGALCFFSCPQGVDDYLIQNNLTFAAAIEGNHLVYVPIEQQDKSLVFDDGRAITGEECLDVSSIPSDASFVIVTEPAFYLENRKVGWVNVLGTTSYVATYNGRVIVNSASASVLQAVYSGRDFVDYYISKNMSWLDILMESPGARNLSELAKEDGSEIADYIDANVVPTNAKSSIVAKPIIKLK